MQPLKGITVVALEHAIAAPFCDPPAGRPGRARDQGRTPRCRRLRAWLRRQRVKGLASHFVWTNRSKESLTLDLKHPQAAARCCERLIARESRRAWCRTWHPVRGGAHGRELRGARREGTPARPHRLRHLGLRRRPGRTRPLPRQEGLRPADPERERASSAVTGTPDEPSKAGTVHRRHRRRHVRLQQHPGRAAAARTSTGQRSAHRHQRCSKSMGRVDPAIRCTTHSMALRHHRAAGAAHATIYPYGPFP